MDFDKIKNDLKELYVKPDMSLISHVDYVSAFNKAFKACDEKDYSFFKIDYDEYFKLPFYWQEILDVSKRSIISVSSKKNQTERNSKSELKHNKVRFVALIRKELRDECRLSGIQYAKIVEAGLMEVLKNGKH